MLQTATNLESRISTAVEFVKYTIDPQEGLIVGAYQFPEYSRWACVEASRHICHALRVMLAGLGLDIQIIEVVGMQPALLEKGFIEPTVPYGAELAKDLSHCIVKVGSRYYDYTARQFCPTADFPMVMDEADLTKYWGSAEVEELPGWYFGTPIAVMGPELSKPTIGILYSISKDPEAQERAMELLVTEHGIKRDTITNYIDPLLKRAFHPVSEWVPLPPEFKLWMPDGITGLDPVGLAACRAEITRQNISLISGV